MDSGPAEPSPGEPGTRVGLDVPAGLVTGYRPGCGPELALMSARRKRPAVCNIPPRPLCSPAGSWPEERRWPRDLMRKGKKRLWLWGRRGAVPALELPPSTWGRLDQGPEARPLPWASGDDRGVTCSGAGCKQPGWPLGPGPHAAPTRPLCFSSLHPPACPTLPVGARVSGSGLPSPGVSAPAPATPSRGGLGTRPMSVWASRGRWPSGPPPWPHKGS